MGGEASCPAELGGPPNGVHHLATSSLLFQSAHSRRARGEMSDSGGHRSPSNFANSDAPEDTKRLAVMNTTTVYTGRINHTAEECGLEGRARASIEGFHTRV